MCLDIGETPCLIKDKATWPVGGLAQLIWWRATPIIALAQGSQSGQMRTRSMAVKVSFVEALLATTRRTLPLGVQFRVGAEPGSTTLDTFRRTQPGIVPGTLSRGSDPAATPLGRSQTTFNTFSIEGDVSIVNRAYQ